MATHPPSPRIDPREYEFCQLLCEPKRFVIDDDEPDRFMHCTGGAVHLTGEDGELGEVVGSFEVTVMDVESAVNEGSSVHQLFDATATTWSYYEALYASDEGDLKDKVMKAIWGEGRYAPNVLILDRVVSGPNTAATGWAWRRCGRCARSSGLAPALSR